MMLRLQRSGTDLKVKWLPGKELFIADTLSRATSKDEPSDLEDELNYVVHSMLRDLAMSEGRKQEIKEATLADSALCKLMEFIRTEFPPHKSLVDSEVRELWNQKGCDLLSTVEKKDLLVIDYYSKYFEVAKLEDGSAHTVIKEMKTIFARHGIPQEW